MNSLGAQPEDNAYRRITQLIATGSTMTRSWELQGGVSAAVHAIEITMPDATSTTVVVRRPWPISGGRP